MFPRALPPLTSLPPLPATLFLLLPSSMPGVGVGALPYNTKLGASFPTLAPSAACLHPEASLEEGVWARKGQRHFLWRPSAARSRTYYTYKQVFGAPHLCHLVLSGPL